MKTRVTRAAAVVAVGLTAAAPASAICRVETVSYSTPERGRVVWIPTSLAAVWGSGGDTQTRSIDQGTSTSSTHGSSDTVGGGAEVGFKLVKVSAKYDHTWDRSTTTGLSYSSSWSYEVHLPAAARRARARLYHKGFMFHFKQFVTYTNGCPTKVFKHVAILPTRSNGSGAYWWAAETYKNRNRIKIG